MNEAKQNGIGIKVEMSQRQKKNTKMSQEFQASFE
jgi:hypothetical protein